VTIPILILYPHSRCNCRCLMCDIWKDTTACEIGTAELERHLDDMEKLSVEWVVLSGGEPLMHSDLFRFCRLLRERRIRTTILSTGLLLERHAAQIVEGVDEVIVSLDGPARVHDRIRRVNGGFAHLARGVAAILHRDAHFSIATRSTVQRENFLHLRETAAAAQTLGLRWISYLAADLTSTAFNRPERWSPGRQSQIALSETEVPLLEDEIEALISEWGPSGFVREDAAKLRRMALHYKTHLGLCEAVAPRCKAPWLSAVIEAGGTVRPALSKHPQVG